MNKELNLSILHNTLIYKFKPWEPGYNEKYDDGYTRAVLRIYNSLSRAMPRNFKPISFEGTKVVFDNIKLKDGDTDYSKGWNDGIKDSWAVVLEHFGRKN